MIELSRLRGSERCEVRAKNRTFAKRKPPAFFLRGLCTIPVYKTEAQRSGFGFERRRDEEIELSRLRGSERCEVRADDAAFRKTAHP